MELTDATDLARQIVFIDTGLLYWEILAAQVLDGVEVVLLDSATDGVLQIATALEGRGNLDAIHILSHGAEGALYLGNTVLDQASLSRYENALERIGSSLAATGDLLLYGCDLAAGESGTTLIAALAEITSADVAASTDLTGFAGDWSLEAASGEIEMRPVLSADVQTAYMGTLDVYLGTAASNKLTGLAGDDNFTGGGGNDTLDGAGGTDTAVFAGGSTGYQFGLNTSRQLTVTDSDPSDGDVGTDTLTRIEQARFAGETVDLRVFGETQVNTYTDGDQHTPSVASLRAGGFVVAWQSDFRDAGKDAVCAQRYTADGVPIGTEVLPHAFDDVGSVFAKTDPAVTALVDGGYLVAWIEQGPLVAQRYSSDGLWVGGATRVDTFVGGIAPSSPAIAALTDGGYLATWQSNHADGTGSNIYAQRFALSGERVGGEITINRTVANDQKVPAAAGLADGGYVVAWQSYAQDGSGWGIYARRYAMSGTATSAEFKVNTVVTGDQDSPAVAALAGGGYVVVWASSAQDGSGYGVYAQRYAAGGGALGGETCVNTTALNNQDSPAVAALADGGYVVTWVSYGLDGRSDGIYAQRFDPSGAAIGGENRINTTTQGDPVNPAIAGLPDGGYVVSWQSYMQDGSRFGVYAQRYHADGHAIELAGDDQGNRLAWSSATPIFIRGNGGDDSVQGGAGNDTLDGGVGSDTVDYATASAAVDLSLVTGTASGGAGTDSVTGFENLFGSAFGDTLTGDAGGNRIDGGTGADTMAGMAGNDVYVVDNGGDVVVEAFVEGVDVVKTSVSYLLSEHVEHLQLTGTSSLHATGNDLPNQILGNGAANRLDGGMGADNLKGGAGDDTYIVDNLVDVVVEAVNAGLDMVETDISLRLPSNVEALTLTGDDDISGTGNSLNNRLIGNVAANTLGGLAGNDTLLGKAGLDRLTGGLGKDVFRFDTPANAANNRDTITDFSVVDDTVQLENAVLTKVGAAGTLAAAAFWKSATAVAAHDASDRIIYNTSTGALFYDPDGTGPAAKMQFATLTGSPDGVTNADFQVT